MIFFDKKNKNPNRSRAAGYMKIRNYLFSVQENDNFLCIFNLNLITN